jgi:hypothetical protein
MPRREILDQTLPPCCARGKLERSVHAAWMKTVPIYTQRFKEAGDRFTQKVGDTLHGVGVRGVERMSEKYKSRVGNRT